MMLQDMASWSRGRLVGLLFIRFRLVLQTSGYGFRLRVQGLRVDAAGHGQLEP